jgi:hypothetical protein
MIKFFRKIRQNLLMENKTGKYLKYAIGEIILVVIGILVALQINNWNENRKTTINECKLVGKMIEQTVTDSSLFYNRIENLTNNIKYIENYISINQGRADSLKYKKFLGDLRLLITMNDGSYLIRNHEDDFKTINDLELREQLMEYSYLSTMQDKAIDLSNFNTLNFNVPIMHKYYEEISNFDTTTTLYEMQYFFKKPELVSHYYSARGWLNNVMVQVEKLSSKNEEVLERLKKYRIELCN